MQTSRGERAKPSYFNKVRRDANVNDPGYRLIVSAPSNDDARETAVAMRVHRRVAGKLGRVAVVAKVAEKKDVNYDLSLAVGDRVQLFARTKTLCLDSDHCLLRC